MSEHNTENMSETYRGEALAWEADDLGHLNMRYYFERAEQARTQFFVKLHLTNISRTDALSTLVPTQQHIHYYRELRPGQGMVVSTGILELGETSLTLLHEISRCEPNGIDTVLSASIVETLSHISTRTGAPFAWPARVRQAAAKFSVDMPKTAHARHVDVNEISDTSQHRPSMAGADILGLPIIGRGAFLPQECDALGFVRASALIGRVSDSVQHLTAAWPDIDFASDDDMSGALLEACARHKNRPRAGDMYVVRTGVRAANTHVRELCHWILDPVSGECWSSFIGVGCLFNLKTRRLVKADASALDILTRSVVKGLKP
jgi:acyl-CoA thioester hydrolase